MDTLTCLSAVDGRYKRYTEPLRAYFSEEAYIKHRVYIEIKWLLHNPDENKPVIDPEMNKKIENIYENWSSEDCLRLKEIEKETNHDVKAIEYFIREKLNDAQLSQWIHFGLTSEDANNTAHALMHKGAYYNVIRLKLLEVEELLYQIAKETAKDVFVTRTHGQPASPSTFGKEIAVFLNRFMDVREDQIDLVKFKAKFNGAVGCFNALKTANNSLEWRHICQTFVEEKLQLSYQPVSTQIEPHDYLAQFYRTLQSVCGIGIDLCNDCWLYISNDILSLKVVENEVGSSTMPHKVNPINFENAEANFSIANAILTFLSSKLQVSRMQRDLSDSSSIRVVGTALGHLCIALASLQTGLRKVSFNKIVADNELNNSYMLLAEPIQTVLRRYNIDGAYEKLKELTRNGGERDKIKDKLNDLLNDLQGVIPDEEIVKLKEMTPRDYTGYAEEICTSVVERWNNASKKGFNM